MAGWRPLWGAIENEIAGAPLGGWQRHRRECEDRIRQVAGPEFERGRAEGHDLTLDAAVVVALETATAQHDVDSS